VDSSPADAIEDPQRAGQLQPGSGQAKFDMILAST
jgi:hypothetical protein